MCGIFFRNKCHEGLGFCVVVGAAVDDSCRTRVPGGDMYLLPYIRLLLTIALQYSIWYDCTALLLQSFKLSSVLCGGYDNIYYLSLSISRSVWMTMATEQAGAGLSVYLRPVFVCTSINQLAPFLWSAPIQSTIRVPCHRHETKHQILIFCRSPTLR